MTREEVKVILGILKTAYPAFYKDLKREEALRVIDLWASVFSGDSAKVVTEAVKALICTLKYPPTIADVKEKIRDIMQPDKMTEMEAWGLVKSAISYYNAQENFNRLPPMIQKIVGSPNQLREWAMMESEIVNSVVQSNFMRSFAAKQKQFETYHALPESTKAMIAGLSEKFELTDGSR